MSYIIFAWIATVAYGLEVVIGKLVSKHNLKNPFAFSFFFSFFSLILTVPFALANHAGFPKDPAPVVITSVFYALATVFYSVTLYRIDVSVLSPLFNLRTGIVVLLSAFIISEVLKPSEYFLILILVLAGFALAIEEKFSVRSFFRKDILIAFATMFFVALWNIYTKIATRTNSFWDFTLWVLIFGQIFMLITIPLFKREIKKISFDQIGALFLVAIASAIGNIAANKANASNVSITAVILSLPISMILAFLLSFIAPKLLEKHSAKIWIIRFAAALIMIVIALILSS